MPFGDYAADDLFFRTDFFTGDQSSFVIHIQQRADSQHTADNAGSFGHASAFDVKCQIRGEEPVMHFHLVFFCPLCKIFETHTFVTQISQLIHKKAEAGRCRERIHNNDFTVRIRFGKCLRSCTRGHIGTGKTGRKAHVKNVFSFVKKFFKICHVFAGTDL